MLLNLHEVQPDKPLRRELELPELALDAISGTVSVHDCHATFRFRVDPLGFAVHYDIRATARMDCIRCSEPVDSKIAVSDWVSLRTQQPPGTHLVLNDSEMNVRFIPDARLDLTAFTEEIVELELPTYPRHAEGSENCQPPEDTPADEQASPFSVLSKYLDS